MVTDVLLAVKGEVRLSKNIGGQYWGSTGIRKENPNLANLMTCSTLACGGMVLSSLLMKVE